MQIHLLKSKLHRARITDACLEYEGSMTISVDLMDRCGMRPYEKVLCSNMANGARFETYAIPGPAGAGEIILNGAAAHLGKVGDQLTIMSYAVIEESEADDWQPKVLVLDASNKVANERGI